MVDRQLEARAGLNVGVEPAGSLFIGKAATRFAVMKGSAETLLADAAPDSNIRLVAGTGEASFPAWNLSPDGVAYIIKLYNEFGETISNPATISSAPSINGVSLPGLEYNILSMAPKEKITITRSPTVGEPGLEDVQILVPVWDAQHKPKPEGGGGLSDGNVVLVRKTLGSTPVDVGPPAGKAWRPVSSFTTQDKKTSSSNYGHFGATGDNPATVRVSWVDPAGVARPMNDDDPVAAQSLQPSDIELLLFTKAGMVLGYPNKIRYQLVPTPGEVTLPIPVGRVMLMAAYVEFDLPKDL